MLTRDERDKVIEALSGHAGAGGNIGSLIPLIFDVAERQDIGPIPLDLNNVVDQSTWLVDRCFSNLWRRNPNPSLMERLLVRLVNQGGQGALAPILTRVRAGIDPNPNPFHALWVLADQPFLDRGPLRAAARQLIEDAQRPILRVNGPTRSGKTYTVELLSYVMQQARPDIHVVPVELTAETGPSYEVEELAESLVLSMQPQDPLPQRNNSSYSAALCRWIMRKATNNSGIWVFVLDGFGQPNLKPEVNELVQLLAKNISIPLHALRMRLVLAHFEQPLTGNWRARTVDDTLAIGAVTQLDLEACLLEFNRKMQTLGKVSKMIQPGEIPALATGMLHACGGPACPELPLLYDALLKLFE